MLMLTTIGAAAVAMLLPGGCSSGGGCTAQNVSLQNLALSKITAAFDVRATVRSPDGKPLAGMSVRIWAWGTMAGQASPVSIQLGTATSDAFGAATLKMPPIKQNDMVSTLDGIAGTTFVKVSADALGETVSDTRYCEGNASVPVTCGPTGQTCPVVGVPKPR
jgi:hypothetical protein